MVSFFAAGAFLLAVISLAVATAAVRRESPPGPSAPAVPFDDSRLRSDIVELGAAVGQLQAQYAQIVQWREDVSIAVAEGIKQVERSENRIRATVRRAREQLEEYGIEHGALDSEARDLQLIDAESGEEEGLHSMPDDVDLAGEALRRAIPGALP